MKKTLQLFLIITFFFAKGQSSNEEIVFDNHESLGIEFYELNKFGEAINEFNKALKIYHEKPRNIMKYINGEVRTEGKFKSPGLVYYYLALAKYHSGNPYEACYNARVANIYGFNDLDITSIVCNITAIVLAIEIYPLNRNFNENETKAWNFYFKALRKLRNINNESNYEDFSLIREYIDAAIEHSPKNDYYLFFRGLIYEIEYFTTGAAGAFAYSGSCFQEAAEMGSELARNRINQ